MFFAIIVAAGKGERVNSVVPKQYLPLLGKPVLAHTLDVFERSPWIGEIIVVINSLHEEMFKKEVWEKYGYRKIKKCVSGGETRQDSVYCGVRELKDRGADFVLIHDGVRPLVDDKILARCVEAVVKFEAACCALPCADTIKLSLDGEIIDETLNRQKIWRAQTPQAFRISLIWEALEKAKEEGFQGTDDSALVERMGKPVRLVLGSEDNLKITTPQDLILAEELLRWRKK
ncbi:MAG TPA: 2-C-methyl-D-erythritol 4-phosphate cytidylyltransferase [Candidatus Atribacteria bacterium]|nr:2-C-methyl-D-erythritol 4-phosphate cytidylyltransferase [Atribacterota bacterium]HOA98677.1 2-C-methyl-D-erythritol 4-phosphate cytidylyltransferase [Candidatus Atribacteria bacterium]MDY0135110.1 2-C-methyl-D-erythritol 4-phosphate cytidylyltransferase [Atribacterota bacterium]HOQ50801.1 2-C-methyl-D-erythritol 4-phosphate cytidylyltransferase [Candidatus Atribacteria bacterium]HPT63352.1 2-C-methyl-D-erythritol 4-phosphate cytidylyltransferase [Candidatus Atribacteria bacterium]